MTPTPASTTVETPNAQSPQSQVIKEGIVAEEQYDARNDARNRERIGLGVLIASIGAVLVISGIVVWKADDKDTASRNVMAMTLPLYGTWVGTILAFYFTRNSFEAASNASARNTELLSQYRGGIISASPPPDNKLAKIALKSLANGLIFSQNDLSKPLKEVVEDLVAKDRYKTIVVDADKKYVSLLSRLNASAFLNPPAGGSNAAASPSLKDYLDWRSTQGPDAQPKVVYLPETASLADAERRLNETAGCQDVIVTIDGSPTSPVVVYITDVDINAYR